MAKTYTKITIDYSRIKGLLSPRKKLDLEGVALGILHLSPDEGYSFLHSHEKQEEVYIVLEGSGRIQIDEELVDLRPGDYVRVSASAHRALCADAGGLTVICTGAVPQGYPRNPDARYLIDDGIPHYDEIPVWYRGNPDIVEKNRELDKRMQRSKEKRAEKNKKKDKIEE